MKKTTEAVLLALCLFAGASCVCGRRGATPPTPQAPAAPYDYGELARRPVDSLPVGVMLPAGVKPEIGRGGDGAVWLTARYPRWGAAIHWTFVPADSARAAAVIANRRQRMTLNNGGAPVETRPVTRPFTGALVTSLRPGPIPVQLLGADSLGVVYGAAFMEGVAPGADPDSVMPVVRLISQEMLSTLGAR